MIGKALGHYQILKKLGEGGMGAVYKARHTRLDRVVAIKVLPAEKVADLDRKRRFVQEAKAAFGRPSSWKEQKNERCGPPELYLTLTMA